MFFQCIVSLTLFLIIIQVKSEVFFEESFLDDTWEQQWIHTQHEEIGKEYGRFILSTGKYFHDAVNDKGIKTTQDARHYGISRKFIPFSNKDRTLVIQFTVKHEQNIDCGGGYIKLFDGSLNQTDLHGESPYLIMFGPDICGSSTKRVHAIVNYNNQNVLFNKFVKCKDDIYSHLYTFIIKPDNTYEIHIDNEKVESGELEQDWNFLAPKKILDPEAKKPEEWDDVMMIDDPDDKKPEDWDKPKEIPDENAQKPDDWDDEMDGEWDLPLIDNPEYKGEWKPKRIKNPNYMGQWVHPEIDNPDYEPNPLLYLKEEIAAVGFDLWQVKSGSIFDNILITDDIDFAREIGEKMWRPTFEAEKRLKEVEKEEKLKLEKSKQETESEEDFGSEEEITDSSEEILESFEIRDEL